MCERMSPGRWSEGEEGGAGGGIAPSVQPRPLHPGNSLPPSITYPASGHPPNRHHGTRTRARGLYIQTKTETRSPGMGFFGGRGLSEGLPLPPRTPPHLPEAATLPPPDTHVTPKTRLHGTRQAWLRHPYGTREDRKEGCLSTVCPQSGDRPPGMGFLGWMGEVFLFSTHEFETKCASAPGRLRQNDRNPRKWPKTGLEVFFSPPSRPAAAPRFPLHSLSSASILMGTRGRSCCLGHQGERR